MSDHDYNKMILFLYWADDNNNNYTDDVDGWLDGWRWYDNGGNDNEDDDDMFKG